MFSAKQKQILSFPTTDYTALICDGAVRSGKTSVMSFSFVIWAMHTFNDHNFAICGKSVQSAVRNVIRPLESMTYFENEGFSLKYNIAEHRLTIRRGNVENFFYVFGGKDESSYTLIQGITLAGVLLDEVALMPRSFVEQALARCSVCGSRFWFNCNPENPNHWFYKEWIQDAKSKNALHLHFLMEDNPSLTKDILERYKSTYSGVFYDRYVLGKWRIAEGLIYPMFDKNKHIIDDLPKAGSYYISIDYGTHNPFSAGLWCLSNDKAYRIDEYYYSGRDTEKPKTDEEYYKELEKLAGDRYIEKIIIDPSASSFIECIKRHGRFSVRHADNDVLNGIRRVSGLLNNGMLLFSPKCEATIEEFGLYSWDDRQQQDKPIKENDHAMDDIRYFTNTILKKEYRWLDWSK